jgi:hypothetical protein
VSGRHRSPEFTYRPDAHCRSFNERIQAVIIRSAQIVAIAMISSSAEDKLCSSPATSVLVDSSATQLMASGPGSHLSILLGLWKCFSGSQRAGDKQAATRSSDRLFLAMGIWAATSLYPTILAVCATRLHQRLSMMIDVEEALPGGTPDSTVHTVRDAPDATTELVRLARARMTTYLALSALPLTALRIVAVGHPRDSSSDSKRHPNGALRLLEADIQTADLRTRLTVAENTTSREIKSLGADMLVGRIEGTGLMLGMSRRLYAACQAVEQVELSLAETHLEPQDVAHLPRHIEDDGDRIDLGDDRAPVRRENLLRYRDEAAERFHDAASSGLERGQASTWEDLIDVSPQLALPSSAGFLEAATEDTYLALKVREAGLVDG